MADSDSTVDGTLPPRAPADSEATLATADPTGGAPVARVFGDAMPRRLGRFVPIRRLGRGGMGVVFEAHDPRTDRSVALKLLLGEARESDRIRLQREAQAMAKLSHPHVVQIYEVGREGGQSYIAMELIDGVSLDRWLAQKPRTVAERLDVFVQAGRGLAAAHREGLVHRDFKPSNVLVGADGRARVLDFGLVRDHASGEEPAGPEPTTASESRQVWATELTRGGALMGTPAYMSPEQYGESEITPKSDQFGFCVALYEALWGRHPFCDSRIWTELAYHIVEEEPRPVPAGHGVPMRVERAIGRGLLKEPSARWPSMDELLSQLLPTRRRSWLALAGVVGAGLAVALGIAYGLDDAPAPPDRCEDGALTLHEAWNDEHRVRVKRALTEVNPTYGPETWERVEPMLDERAQGWLAAFESTCALPADTPGVDSRLRCLERWRRSLATQVELLSSANETVATRAVDAVGDLPPLTACEDPDAIDQMRPLPEDPARAEQVEALYVEFETINAIDNAGHYPQAEARAEAVADQLEQLAFTPLQIHAWLYEGQVRARSGDFERAIEVLERAYFEAEQHDLLTMTRQLADLLAETHLSRGDYAAAERWAQHLRAEVERAGGRGEAEFHSMFGVIRWKQGDHERAAEHQQRALALTRDRPALRKLHASTLSNLGIVRRAQKRYDEALELYDQALSIQQALLGPSHPKLALTLNNRAITLYKLRRFSEAEADLRRTLEIRRATTPADAPDTVNTMGVLGLVLSKQGHYRRAEMITVEALALVRDKPDRVELLSTLELNLGEIFDNSGDYAAAIEHFSTGTDILERQWGPNAGQLIHPLVSLAIVHKKHAAYEDAIALQQRAVDIITALDPHDDHRITVAQAMLAELYVLAQRPARALEFAREARQRSPRALTRARADFVIARAHWAKGEIEPGRAAATRALTAVGDEDPTLRAEIVASLDAAPKP